MEQRANSQPFSRQENNRGSGEIDETLLANFEALNLSETFPSSYTAPPAFSGRGPLNGNLRNNSSFGFSHGNIPPLSYEDPLYSLRWFNDESDNFLINRNLNGSYYDSNSFYDPFWYNSGTRFRFNRSEDFNFPMSRIQQNGSIQHNRNKTRSVNGTKLRYGAETSNGFQTTNYSRHFANFSSLEDLEDLKGSILLVAKDQNGCRFLQRKLEDGKPEERQAIYSELKDHVCELMVHQFANYLIKKIFEVCNEQQLTQLLLVVVNDHRILMEICFDEHGTRSVQKMIEHLTTPEQCSLFVSVLCRITFALTKDLKGHYVIQHCCKYFPSHLNKHILDVIADNCINIATDRSGCCVLQQCIGNAQGESLQRLVAIISANSLSLSEHPYGNFVVQYVLGLDIPQAKAEIVARLNGNFAFLSLSKYGSNVVEKCLRECKGPLIPKIIDEIIYSCNFLTILQDPYGNYVVQSALAESTGAVHNKLVSIIQGQYDYLHSHPYGKRILARTKGNGSYPFRM